MKKYFALPVAIATLTLTAVSVAPAQAASSAAIVQTEVAAGSLLDQARDLLGADVIDAATAAAERLGLDEAPATQGAILAALDPDDYECSPTTPLTDWVAGTITDWTQLDKVFAFAAALTNLAGYASMITPSDSRYGPNGEYSTAITHTFKHLRTFWDIESGDIRLAPMHSAILADRTAVYNTFRTVFHRSEADSAYFADLFSTWASQPKITNHPLNSMNAYAFTGEGDPDPALAALPDQIVMGDGILQAFQAIGLADVAPEAILAHEFGHHVQYEDGLFTSELTGPEATRRTELMADAFAAYFLSHSRGASMQWKRVRLFTQVFAGIGDCGFADPGHHGTPNQRLRSAEWAYSVVTGAPNQGHILPSLTFAQRFDAKLPDLVAPDAGN
ncbi:hypothetical protein GCM10009789_75920 [Kribbella sancticallisti]|uniref:Uncharacterized protein n=1 Tax=Kribbella sancticallisti TaxID=460087 RepID=A0ABP4QG18_9ACTN